MVIISITCATPVGRIYNVTYVSNVTSKIITYSNTCSECICDAFFSSVPPLYVGLNCFQNNKTCALFANYSSPSTLQINPNSTFIFTQVPPVQNTTTNLFPLSGITVAGYGNGTYGSANNALFYPWGVALGTNGTLYVSDFRNSRVMKIIEGSLTGSIVAGTGQLGTNNTQLHYPAELVVDAASNIYINDDFNYRVMLWRKSSSTGIIAAGTGINGTSLNQISASVGLAVDSQGNIYVSDYNTHRVLKWTPNATSGIVVAGNSGNTSVPGNTSQLLHSPYGLFLDENNSYLYIADMLNHRVQRYSLGITTNGTTVAGGNGAGNASNQLNQPYSVCVSKAGDIYIADKSNHRIQRWSEGATNGVTVTGITGINGANATMLDGPGYVTLSTNETFLYVSDRTNSRVQRYTLP